MILGDVRPPVLPREVRFPLDNRPHVATLKRLPLWLLLRGGAAISGGSGTPFRNGATGWVPLRDQGRSAPETQPQGSLEHHGEHSTPNTPRTLENFWFMDDRSGSATYSAPRVFFFRTRPPLRGSTGLVSATGRFLVSFSESS